MGQLEKEMYGRQLAAYAGELKALQSIPADSICHQAGPGAFIWGAGFAFFVSAGLGKLQVEGLTVLFVSPLAPLARSRRITTSPSSRPTIAYHRSPVQHIHR